jgi:hypothetical protein
MQEQRYSREAWLIALGAVFTALLTCVLNYLVGF